MNNQSNATSILDSLSVEERELALSILREYGKSGESKTLAGLLRADYTEIPVDIETFVTDDSYLGKAWKDASGKLKMYPFWLDTLKRIFPNNTDTDYDTLLESGARGLGKSEIACGAVGAYLMYRIMCLRNPLEYYHLKPTEKIIFAFMNITKEASKKIAIDKFQKTVQMSPWFMSRGSMTQFENSPFWIPPAPLQIVIGSQSSDVIGLPVFFCLAGDTIIKTTDGYERLDTLVGKDIRVVSIDESGNETVSDSCTVVPTKSTTDEYEIELEDGTVVKCTGEHRFMLQDGSYKMARELTEGDELFDANGKIEMEVT